MGFKDDLPRVKAKMVYKEKKINSEVRLKGDRKIHFIYKDKSSYKIELKKNQYIRKKGKDFKKGQIIFFNGNF